MFNNLKDVVRLKEKKYINKKKIKLKRLFILK